MAKESAENKQRATALPQQFYRNLFRSILLVVFLFLAGTASNHLVLLDYTLNNLLAAAMLGIAAALAYRAFSIAYENKRTLAKIGTSIWFGFLLLSFSCFANDAYRGSESKILVQEGDIQVIEHTEYHASLTTKDLTCYKILVPKCLAIEKLNIALEDAAGNFSVENCKLHIANGKQLLTLTIDGKEHSFDLSKYQSLEGANL